MKAATSPKITPDDSLVEIHFDEVTFARLGALAEKRGITIEKLIHEITASALDDPKWIERMVAEGTQRAAPVDGDAGAMSDALSDLEVQIELLRMCGAELLAKVGGLTLTLNEDAVASVAFLFGPMHEAFGKQLSEAFAKVHRLAIQKKRTAPAPFGVSAGEPDKAKAALLENLWQRAQLLEKGIEGLSIACESVNTATDVADGEDRSEFSALANWASSELTKRAEAVTNLAGENRRHIEQALASCKSTVVAQP